MGIDKYESKLSFNNNKMILCLTLNAIFAFFSDEDLIKWGWPEDVWFHVDKLSSAHVYLRLRPVSIFQIL